MTSIPDPAAADPAARRHDPGDAAELARVKRRYARLKAACRMTDRSLDLVEAEKWMLLEELRDVYIRARFTHNGQITMDEAWLARIRDRLIAAGMQEPPEIDPDPTRISRPKPFQQGPFDRR